ncbi:glycine receptor subunit alpha-2-like isoform X2 [Artemia franciscana]|uniref:Uncharacterized protein n=1 Tax=Artemia franciscana TaxID=6661 RepID=A0AA88HXE8_ARTSF|nr:hypothetical protein QYM36_006031 [Artemia franciscana]
MLVLTTISILALSRGLAQKHEKKEGASGKIGHLAILDQLMQKGYDRRATPTNHMDYPTRVEIGFYVRSFGSISPTRMDYEVDLYLMQSWHDPRFDSPAISKPISLSDADLVKRIWKPEAYFPNARVGEFQFVTIPNVMVRIEKNGRIKYLLRMRLIFSCMMDLTKFPVDHQVCTMEIASFSKTMDELLLVWKPQNPVTLHAEAKMPQFEIDRLNTSECYDSFQLGHMGNYSCLVAKFYLRRSVGYHLVQSYLPTILIVVISWVSFWMDVDAVPARTTLGITTLLTVSSKASSVQVGLPEVSYVKAIDVWMGACTAFVFTALLEFTYVNCLYRCHKNVLSSTELINGGSTKDEIPTTSLQMKVHKHKTSSRRIDELSRKIFPLSFLIFSILYWLYYVYI